MQLDTTARNALANAFGGLFASGSTLQFRTSGGAGVATIGLASTPFGAAATGVITAGATTPDTNAAGGTVANAVLRDATTAIRATLTVGTSGAEILLSTLSIPAGATVSLSSLTITAPAS